jgi:prepilin-type N-terminal cleavage/methylation domain-containing protein
MKSLIKREQGFTLIEIVIVIAIAAALILLVFLAVSGAQKSKRDQVRKTNAGELGAQLENYLSNNGGSFPGTFAGLSPTYIGLITNGGGLPPVYAAAPAAAVPPAGATGVDLKYSKDAVCAGAPTPGGYAASAKTNAYAVSYWSEAGGQAVCVDNQ